MEIIKYNGREYEVLQVLKKKKEPQDVLLCREIKTGYKECILRMDISKLPDFRKTTAKRELTDEEVENIRNDLKKGVSRMRIIRQYSDIPYAKICEVIRELRKELGITYSQWSDGRKVRRPVIQYDSEMNEIARFPSYFSAANAVGTKASEIARCCQGVNRTAKNFIWKHEEDANDK